MNVSPVACARSSSTLRPPCVVHVRPTSWYSQGWAFFPVLLLALAAFPASVSAAPPTLTPGVHIAIDGIHQRDEDSGSKNDSQSNESISMSVWLPILIVTVVFVLISFATCVRRCAVADAAAAAAARTATTNQSTSTPANGNTTRPRRRPRRTPSQISTKSLPPYMKEPGEQELVLFRGPLETEDDSAPPLAMLTLAEDVDEHPEMRSARFDIALDRVQSVDTMADSSTTNLIRKVSASVPRPPELHHAATPRDHYRSGDAHSLDSVGSEAGLLHGHQREISLDNRADPRGEAPSYTEAVSAEGGLSTLSLNDPELNNVSSDATVPPSLATGRGRLRFSFLMHNPFSSRSNISGTPSNANQPPPLMRSESPALHMRSGSALSRFSTRESHEGHHTRTPSRNNHLARSHSRSNSNLFRAFRSHSPGLHAGSSTISLDNISSPLAHTLTRAEFHAPKGGLLTPEQIKLITSREALERFGVPYGPDAVAAFSLSRERLAEMGPPPEFESVTGERQEQSGASGGAAEGTAQGSDGLDADAAVPRSTSSSLSRRADERAGSRASTDVSYETAVELDWARIVQRYASEDESETDRAGVSERS